jgi:hypothetical protein
LYFTIFENTVISRSHVELVVFGCHQVKGHLPHRQNPFHFDGHIPQNGNRIGKVDNIVLVRIHIVLKLYQFVERNFRIPNFRTCLYRFVKIFDRFANHHKLDDVVPLDELSQQLTIIVIPVQINREYFLEVEDDGFLGIRFGHTERRLHLWSLVPQKRVLHVELSNRVVPQQRHTFQEEEFLDGDDHLRPIRLRSQVVVSSQPHIGGVLFAPLPPNHIFRVFSVQDRVLLKRLLPVGLESQPFHSFLEFGVDVRLRRLENFVAVQHQQHAICEVVKFRVTDVHESKILTLLGKLFVQQVRHSRGGLLVGLGIGEKTSQGLLFAGEFVPNVQIGYVFADEVARGTREVHPVLLLHVHHFYDVADEELSLAQEDVCVTASCVQSERDGVLVDPVDEVFVDFHLVLGSEIEFGLVVVDILGRSYELGEFEDEPFDGDEKCHLSFLFLSRPYNVWTI